MCIFRHTWSVWEQYDIPHYTKYRGEEVVIAIEKRQKRRCLVCNKEQDKRVCLIKIPSNNLCYGKIT
jgi:hypothetical protein